MNKAYTNEMVAADQVESPRSALSVAASNEQVASPMPAQVTMVNAAAFTAADRLVVEEPRPNLNSALLFPLPQSE